jgi:prepilin-type N-terminal cleavage/methylation domain-containing protein
MQRAAKSSGMTLLELLLVMAILGIVLGAGVGIFASLDYGRRQARGFVKNVLRAAQNSAIARQATARVHIDQARGVITSEAMEIVGTWRFERKSLEGVSGLGGTVSGGVLFVEDGFLGDGLYLPGAAGAEAEIPIQTDPAFDFRAGFSLECALRRTGEGGGKAVVVGEVAGIDVLNDGRLRGWFMPAVMEQGEERQGGRVLVESEPGLAVPDRWVRVKLAYDRSNLTLTVDGVPVAAHDETAPVWAIRKPLVLSGKDHPFKGTLVDLVIACVVSSDEVPLPDTVRFAPETPADVWFAPGGGLDPLRHPSPVVLTLEYEDGGRESLLVGAYGTVDG